MFGTASFLSDIEPIISDIPSKIIILEENKEEEGRSSLRYVGEDTVMSLGERSIICFECGKISLVPSVAFSTQCKHCGVYTNLENIRVQALSKRSLIRTQGDVFVEPFVSLRNCQIFCNRLVMEGVVDGDIFCHQDLVIESTCTISGSVVAHTLRIGKNAEVTFVRRAEVHTVIVEGSLVGNIRCQGDCLLKTGSVLMGDVEAMHLELPYGAVHKGSFSHVVI